MAVQVCGFLYVTLEHNIAPKCGRRRECNTMLSLFIVIWLAEFLMVLMERRVYMSAFFDHAPATSRLLSAIAMIFVTHSTVMLGAVLCGHSCHFKPSPDMTWKVFFFKACPLLLILAIFATCEGYQRTAHDNLS